MILKLVYFCAAKIYIVLFFEVIFNNFVLKSKFIIIAKAKKYTKMSKLIVVIM